VDLRKVVVDLETLFGTDRQNLRLTKRAIERWVTRASQSKPCLLEDSVASSQYPTKAVRLGESRDQRISGGRSALAKGDAAPITWQVAMLQNKIQATRICEEVMGSGPSEQAT
jgi:hypothetical protein